MEIQVICKEFIKLDTQYASFGNQGAVLFDDGNVTDLSQPHSPDSQKQSDSTSGTEDIF